jgi:hypothetical protein
MLRLIATDRTPLHLPPEPVRILVLGVYPVGDPDVGVAGSGDADDAALEARLSTVVGEGDPTVHVVRPGRRILVGLRTFEVGAMHESGPLGACVELDQVPAAP